MGLHSQMNQIKKSVTLQVQSIIYHLSESAMPLISSLLRREGSLTVEAACVVPLFLFFFYAVWSIGSIVSLEGQIDHGVMQTAKTMSRWELQEKSMLLTRGVFLKYVDSEYLEHSQLRGGVAGISFLQSCYEKETSTILIQASYDIQIDVPLLGKWTFPCQHQVRQKIWNGYDYLNGAEEEEEYVYVTENESVYHTNRNCTHLILSITEVPYTEGKKRYRACERCIGKQEELHGEVFITNFGDAYHVSLSCSGLKRTVRRVKKSETGGIGRCQRCGETYKTS
ncbi:MAG: TadE/TadG family type IV pilus assembly protein [Lachnospiraceae bacterium]